MQSLSTSSFANHVIETGNSIHFDKMTTIAKIKHLTTRVGREAINNEQRPSCINIRDDSITLPTIWRYVCKNATRRPTSGQQDKQRATSTLIQHTTDEKPDNCRIQSYTQPLLLIVEVLKTFQLTWT